MICSRQRTGVISDVIKDRGQGVISDMLKTEDRGH